MEVHHPHHTTHKKNWRAYLLEFLMLFFAVSLGFLAENVRETYIEKEREHELARSLYQEMRADSIDLEKVIAFRIKKENYLDYLYVNFKGDSDNDSLQKTFQVAEYIGVGANSATLFEPRNAIIHQLESSGMMRYFKDDVLQADLHDIINMGDKVRMRINIEIDIYQRFIMPLSIKYRNTDFQRDFLQMETSGKSITEQMEDYLNSERVFKYPKRRITEEDMLTMHRSFEIYRFILLATRKSQFQQYKMVNAKLLKDLRSHYHL
jgi:hypothetical protein